MRHICVRAAIAAFCTLSLSGCIDSASPILSDSQQLFGPRATFQLYGLRKGFAVEPERVTFSWDGARYVRKSGGLKDVHAFSVHPFEGGDYIVQSVPAKKPDMTEYAVMHRLTDGVYQVVAIDENDADEPTRAAHCDKGVKNDRSCRIKTRDQLLVFARATAAHKRDDGGLAIRLQDDERPGKRRR
jgi:hypothetical protein